MRRVWRIVLATIFSPAAPLLAQCGAMLPGAAPSLGPGRVLTAQNLIGLRDMGELGGGSGRAVIGVSPDGTRIAVQLRRADPLADSLCLAMVIIPVRGGRPIVVDQGGDTLQVKNPLGSHVSDMLAGIPSIPEPRWSPDGRQIAYLRRDGDHTRVWIASADGRSSQRIDAVLPDPEDLAWSTTGTAVIVATRPALGAARRAIAAEARQGYHFDDRFAAMQSRAPLAVDTGGLHYVRLDVATGALTPASSEEAALLDPAAQPNRPARATMVAVSRDGSMAWTEAAPGNLYGTNVQLHVRDADGRVIACTEPACSGFLKALWWSHDGRDLIILKRVGWGDSDLGLYRWSPSSGAFSEVVRTPDMLTACTVSGEQLICLAEGSVAPRTIVSIDLITGARRTLFDPNPEFAQIQLGQVVRLHWRNRYGLEVFGDLTLPPGHRRGVRLPLILVQYESRGFLRGGSGDVYPIPLYAAHGFAVLSVHFPTAIGHLLPETDIVDFMKHDLQGGIERRSQYSALEEGVRTAIAHGDIDPKAIGITGMSEGAAAARFALLHGTVFKAAAISGCCDDPVVPALMPKAVAALFTAAGYPRVGDTDPGFWEDNGMTQNAWRMNTPLLIQASDREYLASLAGVSALLDNHKPVDLYVFADEDHVLTHPAHRLAAYTRSLQWFLFWLQNKEEPVPIDPGQYPRWRAWRAGQAISPAAVPPPPRPSVWSSAPPRLPRRSARARADSPRP